MDIKDPRIDTYLNGEMTSEEMLQFEVEAKQFPTVWEHIQFQQFMIDGIRKEGAAELKDFIANRITEDEQNERTKTGLWWSIAATLVVLIVGVVINYRGAIFSSESKNQSLVAADSTYENNSDSSIAMNDAEPNGNQNLQSMKEEVNSALQMQDQSLPRLEELQDADAYYPEAEDENAPTEAGKKSATTLKDRMESDNLGKSELGNTAAMYLGKINLTPISIGETVAKYNTNSTPIKSVAKPTSKGIATDTIATETSSTDVRRKAKSKLERTPSKKYLITLIEQGGESTWLMVVANTESQSNLTLCNAGSMDVLLFEINQQLYLQLGEQYYIYPMLAPVGVKQKLVPVTNASTLKLLKNP
jgi:hypothetical protein